MEYEKEEGIYKLEAEKKGGGTEWDRRKTKERKLRKKGREKERNGI